MFSEPLTLADDPPRRRPLTVNSDPTDPPHVTEHNDPNTELPITVSALTDPQVNSSWTASEVPILVCCVTVILDPQMQLL